MNNRILRWGLLSTARINRALIPPLRASARNELIAVTSRDLTKARAYAEEWNIPRAYGSKLDRARELGVPVIEEAELLRRLGRRP